MKGYRLTWGIWNREHSIMSRDVGDPEVHPTRKEAEMSLAEKGIYFNRMGYGIWFSNITEIDVIKCENCGKIAEAEGWCRYCGEKSGGSKHSQTR